MLPFANCGMENRQFQHDIVALRSGVGENRGEKERDDSSAVQEQETAASSPSCSSERHFLNSEVAPEPSPEQSHSLRTRTPSPEYSDAVQEQDGDMGETAARRKDDGVSGNEIRS